MYLKLLFGLFIATISFNNASASNSSLIAPPDSTTKLLDKAGAMLLVDEGRALFDEGKVKDALNLFREAAAKDPYDWKPTYWISSCHLHMSNFGFALKYAKESLHTDPENVDKEIFEIIGQSFHNVGQIDSAIVYYNKCLTLLSKTRVKELKINEKIDQCNFVHAEKAAGKNSLRVKLQGDVNSGFNEYAPVLSKGGKEIYFTSRRNNTKGGKTNLEDDQEFFEDIYRAEWNGDDQKWDSITNDIDRINSEGHDAITWIAPNGLIAYMTVNTSMLESKKNRTSSAEICEITFTDKGKWSTPKIIKNKTINTSFFESGATLTADGNTMYFVSDRNLKNSTDIYVVHKVGKKWGEAIAVSDSINSKGRETTPFISADGRFLFFSSDGHPGMGGLDVFVSENVGENVWTTPVNLGLMVNTVNNDSHFQYYPEMKKAVLAGSEVIGQKSSLDIYEVDMSNFSYPKR